MITPSRISTLPVSRIIFVPLGRLAIIPEKLICIGNRVANFGASDARTQPQGEADSETRPDRLR